MITKDHIKRIRPGYGLKPKFFDKLIGKKVISDVEIGDPVTWDIVD